MVQQLWPCRIKNICTKLSSKNHMEQSGKSLFLLSHGKVFHCWWTKSCATKDDDYPVIYKVFFHPQLVQDFWTINSMKFRFPLTQLNRGISLDKSDTCWQQTPQDAIVIKWSCFFFGIPKPRHVTILTGDWNPGLRSPHSRIVGGFNPFCKICSSNWIIYPIRHENKNMKIFETTT